MDPIEGFYKATVQIGGTQSPVLFVLKGGHFHGFDLNDRRFQGTYAQDVERLDVLLTAEVSYLTPMLPGQPRTRLARSLKVRVPAPPAEIGAVIAAELDLDETTGSVVIERLSGPGL